MLSIQSNIDIGLHIIYRAKCDRTVKNEAKPIWCEQDHLDKRSRIVQALHGSTFLFSTPLWVKLFNFLNDPYLEIAMHMDVSSTFLLCKTNYIQHWPLSEELWQKIISDIEKISCDCNPFNLTIRHMRNFKILKWSTALQYSPLYVLGEFLPCI